MNASDNFKEGISIAAEILLLRIPFEAETGLYPDFDNKSFKIFRCSVLSLVETRFDKYNLLITISMK